MTTTRRNGSTAAALLLAAMSGLAASAGGSFPGVFDESTVLRRISETVKIKAMPQAPSQTDKAQKALRDNGWRPSQGGPARKRGPGWTHAQVQRRARKLRNRKANKAAHRG